MTDRPDGGHGEPSPGQQPDDPTWAAPPRDDQWTSVDGPQGPVYPYQPDPGYPNPQHPPTRSFDPADGGYPATGYQQNPYQQNPYPPTNYGYQQPYDQGGYGSGQYPPNNYPPNQYPSDQYPGDGAAAAEPPGGGSSRTLWLIAAVVALLVVIVLVAGYFLVSNSDGDDVATPAATSTVETTDDFLAPTEESPPPTSAAQPSASAAPGQILYSLSGNGQILGLTYAAGSTVKLSPRLINPPWAVATDVSGTASLTAVVLQGQVTCTITLDGRVLDTSTSSTGLLRCEAPAR
ncbi:hypothetical protein [Williamsia maris]|uniref:MmpS family membrane protein n=1 Tax=Williamsia maris TaxID=72806 RepID=A0ABT1HDZ1_9NOCA|nr:hypothetical protein [Williamsia maris]MCP2176379.1 hypothetical protein [Williamsia maris]